MLFLSGKHVFFFFLKEMVIFSLKCEIKSKVPFFLGLILCLEKLAAILIHAAFIDLAVKSFNHCAARSSSYWTLLKCSVIHFGLLAFKCDF